MGSGSIGRDFRSGFCKFGLRPGLIEHKVDVVKADQFILTLRKTSPKDGISMTIYQKVLCAVPKCGDSSELHAWDFSFPPCDLNYRGLYPRSWTKFDIPEYKLTVVLRQISPVFPNDYQDTSLPTTAFIFDVINSSQNDYEVGICFTFRNGTGNLRWSQEGPCKSSFFDSQNGYKGIKGVTLKHTISRMLCSFGIAVCTEDVKVTRCGNFNPSGNGEEIWQSLYSKGCLNDKDGEETELLKELGIAVSAQRMVKAGSNVVKCMEFVLAWDMPVVHFGDRNRDYKRRYTRFFGADGDSVPALCAHALNNYELWETKIEKWQYPVLKHRHLPNWYKSALFNELYFMTDGGSVWFEFDEHWAKEEPHLSDYSLSLMKEIGRFGYLESWEYRMVNTYDVHFYASFALAQLWPRLEHVLQAEFADQIDHTDNRYVTYHMEGERGPTKSRFRVPHDLGNPGVDPWLSTNAYMMHDTGKWKDLNLKFVLASFRDYSCLLSKDKKFLNAVFPAVKNLIDEALKNWDKDGDGMIENSGVADQTYDAWRMAGVSAYCGSLWLAALRVAIVMAEEMGIPALAKYYQTILSRAKKVYINKLWNEEYFNFDEYSRSKHTIMADQLCGYWFLQSVSAELANEILPDCYVRSALNKIYNYNVLRFAGGRLGAVNGMKRNGKIDRNYIQADEMWTGITYALSAFMIQEGEVQRGFDTAWGCYDACYNRCGLQYQTPEALYEHRFYRAIGYMRPLSIWAMQWALEKFCSLSDKESSILEKIRTSSPSLFIPELSYKLNGAEDEIGENENNSCSFFPCCFKTS